MNVLAGKPDAGSVSAVMFCGYLHSPATYPSAKAPVADRTNTQSRAGLDTSCERPPSQNTPNVPSNYSSATRRGCARSEVTAAHHDLVAGAVGDADRDR
jgi:hypothetical protein